MSAVAYGDLLEVIGEVEMAGFCNVGRGTYREWETEVAEPALEDLGYIVVDWSTVERDSFGPLSRIVTVKKSGVVQKLMYG